ncbi:MAG: hydrogenase expression/formation protein HypE [Gammaproteobacteria bacterium]|jgi:hydrogenase expression/formation protein HypE
MPIRALPIGKIAPALLEKLIADATRIEPTQIKTEVSSEFGANMARHPDSGIATRTDILLGPGIGEDACALSIAGGALVAAMDPITMTGQGVGRHAVIINANDVAVTGVRPQWFLATILVPPGTLDVELANIFEEIRCALQCFGACLVGGHTEVTNAVNQPVVIGQMMGYSPAGTFVRTGGLRPGDAVLQVGPAPIEGAALLVERLSPDALLRIDTALVEAARGALDSPGISVVHPALEAARLGATAMHDPTEGGLSTGLWEMANASGVRLDIENENVAWFEAGVALAHALELNPWGLLASGCLLVGAPAPLALEIREHLTQGGYRVSHIGHASAGAGVYLDGVHAPRFERDEISRLSNSPTPDKPSING